MKILYEDSKDHVPVYMWIDPERVEDTAMTQIEQVAKMPYVYPHLVIMPDVHAGMGATIGSVIPTENEIIPAAVGVDIGCGMCAVQTDIEAASLINEDIMKWLQWAYDLVPVGFNSRPTKQMWEGFDTLQIADVALQHLVQDKAPMQLGTLGGGNHFIELQKDENGYIWIMVHSGSRHIGFKIANHYIKQAKILCERLDYPKDLCTFPAMSPIGQAYLRDMNWALEYAQENRARILFSSSLYLRNIKPDIAFQNKVNIHHNYVSEEYHQGKPLWIHRKGATAAFDGQLGIIPGSMGTASYIVMGKGNVDSFCSCSHGAGRVLARGKAKKTLSMAEFEKRMAGIAAPVDAKHLDESPMAYKDIDQVMKDQSDLVTIVHRLEPIAVVKG